MQCVLCQHVCAKDVGASMDVPLDVCANMAVPLAFGLVFVQAWLCHYMC